MLVVERSHVCCYLKNVYVGSVSKHPFAHLNALCNVSQTRPGNVFFPEIYVTVFENSPVGF